MLASGKGVLPHQIYTKKWKDFIEYALHRDGVGHFLPIYKKFYNLPIIYMEEYDEDLLEIITENADNRK